MRLKSKRFYAIIKEDGGVSITEGRKNTKRLLSILFLLALMSLSSCNIHEPEPIERTYVSTEITYSEPIDKYAFRSDMELTETRNAKYYFEANVDSDEREACIEVTEKVLSNQAHGRALPEIYIFSQENYITGSSFVQYPVKQYVEEAVINSVYADGAPCPKPISNQSRNGKNLLKPPILTTANTNHNWRLLGQSRRQRTRCDQIYQSNPTEALWIRVL